MPDESDKQAKILSTLKTMKDTLLYFAKHVLKVQTTKGKIVPLQLNNPQKILHSIVEMVKLRRPVRLVALKARRMGFSTYFSARYYWRVSWNHNRYATQITHEPEATDALFKMVKRFYDFSPVDMRPSTKYNNTRLLEFNTKDGRGLNSGFRVATAGKEDFGSGQLIHYCHLSETSKWPSETTESLLTSILQCVPDDDESEVVFESTAKGIGGAFYERFWGARYRVWVTRLDEKGNPVITEEVNSTADKENIYTSIFLPWFVFEENILKAPDDFTPDKDELKLIAQYGVNFNQLYWRRRSLASKCDGNLDIFKQEYPSNPQEAFLGTGRPVFDNTKLFRYHAALPEPIANYECLTGTGQWMTTPTGRLSVWEEPKHGRAYIIGADVSEGLAKGDFSVADVIDHQTGKQVAQWHGHVDADIYAEILISLGKRYNMAWLGIERNNHGLTTVTWVCNARYPYVYAEMVPDPPGKPRKRFGWLTSSATRPLILDNIVREVREDAHGIMCRATIEEMMSFKIQDNGRYEADGGRFDDRVMSLSIAKYLRQTIPLPAMKANDKNFFQDSTHRRAMTKKDHLGWT